MIEKGKERFKIMDDNYCVYIHTNKINGKKYVGQTKHGDNPKEKRWKYGDGYKSCTYFYNAILKYGWNNFEHEIVVKNLTKDEAYSMEQKLISELDTRNPNVGYNIRIGGEENYSLSEIEQLKRIQTLKDTVREKHKQQSFEKYQERFNNGDPDIKQCKRCGALFEIKNKWNREHTKKTNMKSRKYCEDCRNVMYSKSPDRVISCIDCGIYLIVKPNDINTCRCKECQKEHRKTANRERQKRYRDSKKNSVEVNF